MRSALWRDRGFVQLWAAEAISNLGTQVTLLALPLAALLVLHAGTLATALLRSFAILPFLLFSLPAGVWVDRLRRRPLMIAADLGRALAIASIPAAYWLGHLTMTQLYVVAGIHGFLTVVFDVSYLSFLPSLVDRSRLQEANTKLLTAQSFAEVGGPTMAGGLVATVGAPAALLADAASFALSGGLVSRIRGREPKPERRETPALEELREGLRYVFAQPFLRTLATWFAVCNLFTTALFTLMIVYFVRGLRLGAGTIGLTLAAANLGLVAGALANGPLVRVSGSGR